MQFLLSANPGTPLLPLSKVASGGELARTMLALRLVMTAHETDPAGAASTLIFDEVDAGIGGAAATAVGEALAGVAAAHQVIVVTHLAQVAAFADDQIAVAKGVVDGATTATAEPVDGDRRVAEVARMLSGDLGGSGSTPPNGTPDDAAPPVCSRRSARSTAGGGGPGYGDVPCRNTSS